MTYTRKEKHYTKQNVIAILLGIFLLCVPHTWFLGLILIIAGLNMEKLRCFSCKNPINKNDIGCTTCHNTFT